MLMKKALNIISNIFTFVLMGVALFAVIFTVFTQRAVSTTTEENNANEVDNSERSLFGCKFFIVLSDSMSATDFSAGDMIVSKEVDPNTLREGDIITFYSQDTKSFGEIVTHKIREVKYDEEGNLLGFITYGTTTGTNDEALAEPSLIIGKYTRKLPKVGYFIQFMKTPIAYIFFVAVPFILIIGHEVIRVVKIINANKREKLKQESEQRGKLLDEERLRNEQMQRELEELRKQLAATQKSE